MIGFGHCCAHSLRPSGACVYNMLIPSHNVAERKLASDSRLIVPNFGSKPWGALCESVSKGDIKPKPGRSWPPRRVKSASLASALRSFGTWHLAFEHACNYIMRIYPTQDPMKRLHTKWRLPLICCSPARKED